MQLQRAVRSQLEALAVEVGPLPVNVQKQEIVCARFSHNSILHSHPDNLPSFFFFGVGVFGIFEEAVDRFSTLLLQVRRANRGEQTFKCAARCLACVLIGNQQLAYQQDVDSELIGFGIDNLDKPIDDKNEIDSRYDEGQRSALIRIKLLRYRHAPHPMPGYSRAITGRSLKAALTSVDDSRQSNRKDDRNE